MNNNHKFRIYIYFHLVLFALGCKNDKTQHYDQQVEIAVDTLTNDQDKTSVRIVGMPDTEGVMTITDYVSGQSNFTPEFKLLTLPDNKAERLFIQYFTGGAHCCTNLQVYKFNSIVDAFEYLDEYSYDGESAEIEYPFKVNYGIEYFHTAYAYGGFIDCPESNFTRYLYLINDKFEFKSTGDYNAMKRCLINYLQTTTIPELADNSGQTDRSFMFDKGERETVVNFMLEMFTLNNDIGLLQDIYMKYFSNVSDKQVLWDEISAILLKNGMIHPTEQLVNALVKSRKEESITQENLQSSSGIVTTNTFNNTTSDELPSDCDELLELVQNEGDRIQYLGDSDMNSTALNKASLYEYDGIYYVVIRFQDGNHEYVYCDIDLSYWNRFADNDEESYGRGYQNWIRPYTSCDCGR
jgi:hypothetical protein